MPTYDYRCAACGHAIEVFHSIHEKPHRKCPKCGKPKLERLIGKGAGILFKGGGFYQTDYRSESYKQGASAEKDEGKPAADAEAKKPGETPAGKDGETKGGEAKAKHPKGAEAAKPRKKSSD